MPASSRLTRVLASLLLLLLVTAGCGPTVSDAQPEDIPRIRSQLASDPGNPALNTRLGIALYKDEQYDEAERVLAAVTETDGATGATYLYLGLAQEAQEDWTGARDAYQTYLEVGRSPELRDEIRSRLALMVKNSLRQQARATLQQEDELSDRDPTPRSVAVFPFQLISDREELEPLQVALADMMVTDFALVQSITVLERAQVQSLLNEMALTEAGYTEPSTGARAGRLLQAEHVVQGALTTTGQNQLRFDADLLNTTQGSSTGGATAEEELEALFEVEKQIVFDLLADLQVELTPAEREAISENRAENLLAFLEYGRGLQAMDRGNYQQASQFFNSAVSLDPTFQAAQSQEQEAQQLEQASQTSTTQVAQSATSEVGGAITAPPPTGTGNDQGTGSADVGNTLANIDSGTTGTNSGTVLGSSTPGGSGNDPGSKRNDPVQESQGQDTGTTAKTTIRITIPRPTGSGGGR